jgi:hypothetical protein
MFQSRTRVGPAKLITFGAAGFLIGILMGYLFMGTIHAVRLLPDPCVGTLHMDYYCFRAECFQHLLNLNNCCLMQMLQLREEARHVVDAGKIVGSRCSLLTDIFIYKLARVLSFDLKRDKHGDGTKLKGMCVLLQDRETLEKICLVQGLHSSKVGRLEAKAQYRVSQQKAQPYIPWSPAMAAPTSISRTESCDHPRP